MAAVIESWELVKQIPDYEVVAGKRFSSNGTFRRETVLSDACVMPTDEGSVSGVMNAYIRQQSSKRL